MLKKEREKKVQRKRKKVVRHYNDKTFKQESNTYKT